MSSHAGAPYDLERGDIIEKCSHYPTLVRDFVGKSLDPAPPPDGVAEFEAVLADNIGLATENLVGQNTSEDIVQLHKEMFGVSVVLKVVADITEQDVEDLRSEFYGGLGGRENIVSHPAETFAYPREGPVVDKGVKYLLDDETEGGNIPQIVKKRYLKPWLEVEERAERWGEEFGLKKQEALEEIIPILMAVEIHTGGDPDRIGRLRSYLVQQMEDIALTLVEEGILREDKMSEVKRLLARPENFSAIFRDIMDDLYNIDGS